MPLESTWRRTTTPAIYENIIGQIDEPHIGDPGLFIGADEDGNVPVWASIPPVYFPGTLLAFPFAAAFGGSGWSTLHSPAKRRKMANIVTDKYIKRNLFYVHFDLALADLFPASFINDLRESPFCPGHTCGTLGFGVTVALRLKRLPCARHCVQT